jgi:hypothetical protein
MSPGLLAAYGSGRPEVPSAHAVPKVTSRPRQVVGTPSGRRRAGPPECAGAARRVGQAGFRRRGLRRLSARAAGGPGRGCELRGHGESAAASASGAGGGAIGVGAGPTAGTTSAPEELVGDTPLDLTGTWRSCWRRPGTSPYRAKGPPGRTSLTVGRRSAPGPWCGAFDGGRREMGTVPWVRGPRRRTVPPQTTPMASRPIAPHHPWRRVGARTTGATGTPSAPAPAMPASSSPGQVVERRPSRPARGTALRPGAPPWAFSDLQGP